MFLYKLTILVGRHRLSKLSARNLKLDQRTLGPKCRRVDPVDVARVVVGDVERARREVVQVRVRAHYFLPVLLACCLVPSS